MIDLETWFENHQSDTQKVYSDIYHLNRNNRLGMPIHFCSNEEVYLFFILGTLLNDKGGNLVAKAGYIRKRLSYLTAFDFSQCAESHRLKFEVVKDKICELFDFRKGFNHPREMLMSWWEDAKEENNKNLDQAGFQILQEISNWSYRSKKGTQIAIMPVKSFWIARELKIYGIWKDIPNRFCCIPDSIVRQNLYDYLINCNQPKMSEKEYRKSFDHFKVSQTVSEIVEGFIEARSLTTVFPFDLPFFKRELKY